MFPKEAGEGWDSGRGTAIYISRRTEEDGRDGMMTMMLPAAGEKSFRSEKAIYGVTQSRADSHATVNQ